jgi:histidyl-tRNA synthetase
MSGKLTKARAVSGFPEWLPEERMVELAWLDTIRGVFESYGFCNIETPSVEELDVLLAKGETDKEIYVLKRLQEEAGEKSDARLGLHYDVTVPCARYVAQHFNDLVFPFKRYQMQRVWRGERPQEGRFREFTQCDIDVIAQDELAIHFDAELPSIILEILDRLAVGPVKLLVSNRKILIGYLSGLSIDDTAAAVRILDKLDKIGPAQVVAQLQTQAGLDEATSRKALGLAEIKTEDASFVGKVRALGVDNEMLSAGLDELAFVMRHIAVPPSAQVVADLSIARGFDYYTGSVYEARLVEYPDYGSIGAGGRYDDLAGSFISKKLPGVGISLGLTRLFSKMLAEKKLAIARKSPADVLVVLPAEERRAEASATAQTLRARGFKVELFHAASKLKRQLAYAERKGIPFVWFPPFEEGLGHEVKDMASGAQSAAEPARWTP